jgi:hypothetical protein
LFSGKKNKTNQNVPHGWISYRNKRLTICCGNVKSINSNAPKGTAWDGIDQHQPEDDECILCAMEIKIWSLQQLFGVAEGVLSTL